MFVDSAIGFLVVNRNSNLPYLSIMSAIKNSDSDIFIGFIDEVDILDLPTNERISYVKLDPTVVGFEYRSQKYKDFSSLEFYRIVQLKWQLLQKLIDLNYFYIVYSDFDIVWLQNPIPEIAKTLDTFPGIHLLIQSFTTEPSQTRLCMGFAVFRNSSVSKDFLISAKELHSNLFLTNPLLGDDDVVTRLYGDLGQPSWIRELPQATFPVGSMLNLFSKKNSFPGLSAPYPYIFHANYVVGLKNKRILMYIILRRFKQIPLSGTYFSFLILITLKRLKYFVINQKKSVFD